MIMLPETHAVLASLPANERLGTGEHIRNQLTAGVDGLVVGSVPFDPARHSPHTIMPFSAMGIAVGESYVSEILPARPLSANIVVDLTMRSEDPLVRAAKATLAGNLTELLQESAVMTDRIYPYVIGEAGQESIIDGYDLLEAKDPEDISTAFAEIATAGLTFVISDFRRMRFDQPDLDLSTVVAVKANHKMERWLRAGMGRISLGGYHHVNTNKPRELKHENENLQRTHEELVNNLENAGAAVASVVIEPKLPGGYDLEETDRAIAMAVRKISAI